MLESIIIGFVLTANVQSADLSFMQKKKYVEYVEKHMIPSDFKYYDVFDKENIFGVMLLPKTETDED